MVSRGSNTNLTKKQSNYYAINGVINQNCHYYPVGILIYPTHK
jgi:hypothetical protein